MAESKSRTIKFLKLALVVLGLALLWVLVRRVGLAQIAAAISQAKLIYIAYGLAIYLLLILTRSLKWFLLLKTGGGQINYLEFLPFYLVNSLISNISPLKSGEAATPFILKKYLKIPASRGFSVVILDRFFELVFFTLIFISAVVYIIKAGAAGGLLLAVLRWSLAGFILLILLLLAIIIPGVSTKIFLKLNIFKKYLWLNKILEFLEKKVQAFHSSLALFKNKKIYRYMIPLTLLGWVFEFSAFYFIFTSIMSAPFFNIASAHILAIAATLVTFIPGGMGVGELGIVYILNQYGYQAVLSTAGVLLARLVLTGTVIFLGLFGTFMLKERE